MGANRHLDGTGDGTVGEPEAVQQHACAFEFVECDMERIIEAKTDETDTRENEGMTMKIKVSPRSLEVYISDGDESLGYACLTSEGVPFEKAWQMTFIEVYERHRRKGVATKLYQWAKEFAAERGCRLVPHPDMSWDWFAFCMAMDGEALLEVLSHERSHEIVEESGGDVEQLAQQLELLRSEKKTLH